MTIARMVTCTHRGLCGETTLARRVIEIDNTSTRGHIVERLRRHNGFDRRVRREYLRMFTYFQLGQILSQIILEAFLLQSTKKNPAQNKFFPSLDETARQLNTSPTEDVECKTVARAKVSQYKVCWKLPVGKTATSA